MKQKKINITDLQGDWSRFFEPIDQGDELIITRLDEPIAIVSPFNRATSTVDYLVRQTDTTYEEQMALQSPDNRWWFG